MKIIKVLQVGLSPNTGGIENVVHSWWCNISHREVHFDFLNVWDKPIAFQDEFVKGGAKIIYKPLRKENPTESYNVLKSLITGGEYDYIHCHIMSLSEPEPVLIAQNYPGTVVILHSHTAANCSQMGLKRYMLHLYGKLRLRKCKYVEMACGHEAGLKMFGNNKFMIIRNGVNREVYKYSEIYRNEIRQKVGVCEDEFLIGHVGRPCKAKNYPFLLKVFSEFVKNNKAKLLLIGDVAGDEAINKLIDELEIRKYTILTGPITDTYKYYSAMDCFFMPSLYEGISVALIEAQSTGLECVASNMVDPESKAGDNLKFVAIENMRDSLEALEAAMNSAKDRSDNVFSDSYDVRESAQKIHDFYLDNK